MRRVGVSERRESPSRSAIRRIVVIRERSFAKDLGESTDATRHQRAGRRGRRSRGVAERTTYPSLNTRTFKVFFFATTSRNCVLLSNRPHATRYRPVDTSAPFEPSSVVSQNAMTPARHRPSPVAISTSRPISGSSLSSYERGAMTSRSRPGLGARRECGNTIFASSSFRVSARA